MRSNIVLLCLLSLLAISMAHPTYYPDVKRTTCTSKEPPEIYSYHVHLLYDGEDEGQVDTALNLYFLMMDYFSDILEGMCPNLFHSDYSCIGWVSATPMGIFTIANWFFYAIPDDVADMMAWLVQRRGEFSIMVHPNTGCVL